MPRQLIWNSYAHGTYVKSVYGQIGSNALPLTEHQLLNRKKVQELYLQRLFQRQNHRVNQAQHTPNLIARLMKWVKRVVKRVRKWIRNTK